MNFCLPPTHRPREQWRKPCICTALRGCTWAPTASQKATKTWCNLNRSDIFLPTNNDNNRTFIPPMTTALALVVDDSRMPRHMLSKMLKEQGIDVDTVESGEEALGYLCSKKPTMIFMDHTMPGMDGSQTLRAIKNEPHTSAIPIIMYTSKEGEVYE